MVGWRRGVYIIKNEENYTPYSCEMEDFVETRMLQAVCDTPIARIASMYSGVYGIRRFQHCLESFYGSPPNSS